MTTSPSRMRGPELSQQRNCAGNQGCDGPQSRKPGWITHAIAQQCSHICEHIEKLRSRPKIGNTCLKASKTKRCLRWPISPTRPDDCEIRNKVKNVQEVCRSRRKGETDVMNANQDCSVHMLPVILFIDRHREGEDWCQDQHKHSFINKPKQVNKGNNQCPQHNDNKRNYHYRKASCQP